MSVDNVIKISAQTIVFSVKACYNKLKFCVGGAAMEQFRIPVSGKTPEACVYIFGRVRVSALADRLLRVEYSQSGRFCDQATQVVWNRAFAHPATQINEAGGKLKISTNAVTWEIDRRGHVRSMRAADGRVLSLKGNLKGTRRTLDFSFGRVKL